jgi:hypothetical protein
MEVTYKMKLDQRIIRIVSLILRFFLCICTSLQLISCGTVPKQIYLTNTSLSSISKVAIISSANSPEVSYSNFDAFLPPSLIILINKAVDQGIAAGISEHTDLSYLEEKLVQSFMEPIKKSARFQTTKYLTVKNQDKSQLLAADYDAIIRLSLHKISVEKNVGDYIRLYVFVHGQLESLRSRSILWDREEVIKSQLPRSIDYYKQNGLKEIDAIIERAGQLMAYDFVYSK